MKKQNQPTLCAATPRVAVSGSGAICLATASACAAGGGATGTSITNTTPVTANANSTSEQFLMELQAGAGYFNSSGQPFLIHGAFVYTTPAAQTPTITINVRLCTVSGCGSGTNRLLAGIVSTATLASVTNNTINVNLVAINHATGATGTLEVHGPLSIDLGALTTTADSIFNDVNTAVSGTIDLTAALFIDFTVTFSTNAASANSITQRSGSVMPFAATAAPVTSVSIDGGSAQTGAVALTSKVTSVNTLTGAVTLFNTNAKTATYQALATDFAQCKTIPVASGTFTITLVASGTQPPDGQCLDVINYGSGVVTIARSGQNINGGTASYVLQSGSALLPSIAHIVSNGTDYFVGGSINCLTTAGDICYGGTTGLPTRLAGAAGILRSSGTVLSYAELSGDISTSGSNVTTIGAAKVAPSMMKASTFDAQTDGATITWAIASVLNANASVTLGGNRTLNITNPVIGGNYVFKITQDGTGSRTLTLGTGCTWKVISGGAGAITLTTTANAVDVLAFTYDGTNCLANLGKNYN